MKRCHVVFLLLFILSTQAVARPSWQLEREVVSFRLPNGMTWLLVRRPIAPIFAGMVVVKVGGVEEVAPKIGLAHMFEHMAFKGTKSLGTTDYAKEAPILAKIAEVGEKWVTTKDKQYLDELTRLQKEAKKYQVSNELFLVLTRNGARDVNAHTSKDLTSYHSMMPSNKLALWLTLYEGMLGDPVLREFYTERDVVQEERRSSVENNPMGRAYQLFIGTAFEKGPYHYSTIGAADQIGSLTIQDALAFYAKYYHPDRMVGALVGDIDIPQAKALIAQTFGQLPAVKSVQDKFPVEPPQTEERRATIDVDAAPFILMGYHKPRIGQPEDYIFDVIEYIVCEGRSSRFYQTLITDLKIARSIQCSVNVPGDRLDNVFFIQAEPLPGQSPKVLEAAIRAQLEKLGQERISADELKKARNNLASNFLWQMTENDELAEMLAMYQSLLGDWRYIIQHPQHIAEVTAEDVQRVAKAYFQSTNLTVVTAE